MRNPATRKRGHIPWRELTWYLEQCPELGSQKSPPTELVHEERRLAPDATQGREIPSLITDIEPDRTCTASIFRARAAHQYQPGDSIDDFDLLARLGRGAFATVFLARQMSMQRLVALKISADEGLEGPTLAKLNHPHIVRVFDQRTLPEESLRLMYMEYVAGGSLDDVIKQATTTQEPPSSKMFLDTLDQRLAEAGNSAPPESTNRDWIWNSKWHLTVSRIGTQLADAIEYTHGEGVLHRDIKPANVLVDGHGFPKLVDFNISYGNAVVGATAASCFGGSLGYMSPEQLEAFHPLHERTADQIDGSCDVYALGITLYELLTGKRPFPQSESGDPLAMIDQMIAERKVGLANLQTGELHSIEHLLAGVIADSLHPEAESRPTVAAMRKRLQWASDIQISNFMKASDSLRSNLPATACRLPWLFILSIVFGVAIFATWFITAYNVTESVLEKDAELFMESRQMINRIVFPLALVVLIGLFFRTQRLLGDANRHHSEDQFRKAICSNLNFGHSAAVMCIAMWVIAGLLYPIVLTVRGAELPTSAWADFSISHLLAGLISAAFVFFGLTMLSVVAWHPRLVMTAMRQGVFADVKRSVHKIRSRVYFYRVLAIGAPLVAIATLVNFRTSNTFAVSFLSIGAIVGLLAMANAIQRIGNALDLIERS